jgi:hypothetical protein
MKHVMKEKVMFTRVLSILAAAGLVITAGVAQAATVVIHVPADQPTLAAAAAVANADTNLANYYDIRLAPGTYTRDFADLPIQLEQAAQPLREAGGHGGRRRAGCLSLADRR